MDTSGPIDPDILRLNNSLLASMPTFTGAQLKTFKYILCDVVRLRSVGAESESHAGSRRSLESPQA